MGKERAGSGGQRAVGSRQLVLLAVCLLFAASRGVLLAQGPGRTPAQKPAAPPAPPPRIDAKAQELLDKTIQALGGQAFLQAKSLTTRGRIFAISEDMTSGFAPFESTVEFPDKRRFSYGKDKPVILLNDGDRGWEVDRYGLIDQPAEQLRRWRISVRYGYENVLRQLLHEPGVLAQGGGTDFVDNLPARIVEITDARQVHVGLYLHALTFLPIRLTYRLQNPQTQEWEEYADVYSDYRPAQGIQTPMHIGRLRNGERYSEVFRTFAEYNTAHPPDYFRP